MNRQKRKNDWENPYVLQINREPMHAPWGAYSSELEAAGCNRRSSPYVQLLDGTWTFQLFQSPESVPPGFYENGYATLGWSKIQVPGCWELQGFDKPIYTNIRYPFDVSDRNARFLRSHYAPEELEDRFLPLCPPYVPEHNPTGCYITEFTVPEHWSGRELLLNFESVESAFYIWLNGSFVGYSQDSKLPAEFNVSEYIRPGSNKLALQVMKWSDGTYLEDQDYWHLSGIHRSVALYSKPKQHIRDFKVHALLDDQYRDGKLIVYAYVNKQGNYGGCSVQARLLDPEGADAVPPIVARVSTSSPMYGKAELLEENGAALLTCPVPTPRQWSAEKPHLYTLVLTLLDPNGEAVDYESCRVGFRRIELSPDGVILLNGKRLIVRGVNRHEHHPDTGRTISAERMREEIVKIKQLNFNAVRTSHYPNDPLWYELCDELGLYLVDETNLESHGMQCTLSKDPEWALAYLERAMRVVLRDKNHPSILFWSLGNESGAGANHAAMAGWIRYYDPHRLVQYESGDPGPLISDIRVPMYPPLSWVEDVMTDMRDKRPMIMCEYAYSKSNSNGNFFKFWEMVDKYPRFQGGFVWDWSDKAIRIKAEDGTFTWGYGGDFGESVVDRVPDMCLNGVVSPDLEPHPGAFEIKKLQAPVAIIPADARAGRFIVMNKHAFSNLSHLMLKWQLLEDGLDIQAGTMFLPDTNPGEQNSFTVPFEISEEKAGSEYFIHLSLCLQTETAWAPAGFELYAEQAELPARAQTADVLQEYVRLPHASGLSVTRNEEELTIRGAGFNMEFDLREGIVAAYAHKGKPLLLNGATENYFRAPTGIDSAQGTRFFYGGEWQSYGLDRLVRDVRSVQVMASNAESVVLEAESFLHPAETATGFRSFVTYTVRSDGSIEIRNRVDAYPELALLPRIGLSFTVPAALGGLQWYGRGPHENYADRKKSAHIGLYRSYVDEQPCPYIVPVEHGGREDVRWFALTDSEGSGLKFEGFAPFHMDVHRNSVDDYKTAKHAEELPVRDRIWVNIDHVHSGLGGDTGWTRNIHEEYQVKPGRYEFSFTIRPVV